MRGDEKTASQVMASPHWEVADTIFVVSFFVDYKVLTDDDNATWAVVVSRNLNQWVGCFVYRKDVFGNNVIQAKVHFIKCQGLLEVASVDSTKILIKISIIDLKTSKLRILNAYINSDHGKCDHMRFEGF